MTEAQELVLQSELVLLLLLARVQVSVSARALRLPRAAGQVLV